MTSEATVDAWERFVAAAERFCRLLDEAGRYEPAIFRHDLHVALAALYAAATELPDVEPATDRLLEDAAENGLPPRVTERLDVDLYWCIEPTIAAGQPPERRVGSLIDDLSEIAEDLGHVLAGLTTAPLADVRWQARFDFRAHWGQHAVDALLVTHPWVAAVDDR